MTDKHGMTGKRNAAKSEDKKVTGKGRLIVDIGELKAQVVRQLKSGEKLSDWVRDAITEKLNRNN